MSSEEDVIDALFDRTVDIVQSLPKTGPIQTSYEEKLSLYSLYKQATEGDVRSSRPGMFDMLGRAKWDAWAKRKGTPRLDAKRMYVESMFKILRKYSDRPQAVALIQELENFGGDVSSMAMSGSLTRDTDEDSSSSQEDLDLSTTTPAEYYEDDQVDDRLPSFTSPSGPRPSSSQASRAGPSGSSTGRTTPRVLGTSLRRPGSATAAGRLDDQAALPRSSSQNSSPSQTPLGLYDERGAPPPVGPGRAPSRQAYPFPPGPPPPQHRSSAGFGTPSTARPPSALGAAAGQTDASLDRGERHAGSAAPSSVPSGLQTFHPAPSSPSLSSSHAIHHYPPGHPLAGHTPNVLGVGGPSSTTGDFPRALQSHYPSNASSAALPHHLLSGRAGGPGGDAASLRTLYSDVPGSRDPAGLARAQGVERALEAIQVSLAALHERCQRLEALLGGTPAPSAGSGEGGAPRRGGTPGPSAAAAGAGGAGWGRVNAQSRLLWTVARVVRTLTAPFVDAWADVTSILRLERSEGTGATRLVGLGPGQSISDRRAFSPGMGGRPRGADARRGRQRGPLELTVALMGFLLRLCIATLNLVIRLGLDLSAVALVVTLIAAVWVKVTGRGHPLIVLAVWRRILLRGRRNTARAGAVMDAAVRGAANRVVTPQ